MPAYRRLHPEELESLRDEFVQFLAANSITAEDWKKLKQLHAEDAEKVIDIFSDIVWEKVLTKTEFVELRYDKVLQMLKFGESTTELIQIAVRHPDFDFRKPEDIAALAEGRITLNSLDPEIHTGRKSHGISRNEEVFHYLEKGGIAVDAVAWELLSTFVGDAAQSGKK